VLIRDTNMPGEDDFPISRRTRTRGNVRSPMLSACDRVVRLEPGVDDDLMKPFDLREPCARILIVLRRTARLRESRSQPASSWAQRARFYGVPFLNPDPRRLSWLDGTGLPVSAAEFELRAASARRPGRPLGCERLLDLAGNHDCGPCDRSIDVRGGIRGRAAPDPDKPQASQTIRGARYMFVPSKP
jgi:DNA-binding response OmpR family regulator